MGLIQLRPEDSMDAVVTPHRFTVDDVYRMVESGLIPDTERLELFDGVLVKMSPKNNRHELYKNRLTRWLNLNLPDPFETWVETTVRISETSYLEPDLSVFQPRKGMTQLNGSDLTLVIEISDTTLKHDLKDKLPLFAEAGVPQVWIVDVNSEQVLVFQQPERQGYIKTQTFSFSDRLPISLVPDKPLKLVDLSD